MQILYLEQALEDLAWFHKYYVRVFSDGAENALKQFDAIEIVLLENPFIGHRTEIADIREISIPKTPFSFIYRVRGERIEVLRVWDERRER